MEEHHQFRGDGVRGPLDPLPPGKTRITIRLDNDVLDWFQAQTDAAGGGNYQTAMNAVLRAYMIREGPPPELPPRLESEPEPDDSDDDMKDHYDFSKGRRGPILPPPPNTTPVTIQVDDDILEWFMVRIDRAGGRLSVRLMNHVLRERMWRESGDSF